MGFPFSPVNCDNSKSKNTDNIVYRKITIFHLYKLHFQLDLFVDNSLGLMHRLGEITFVPFNVKSFGLLDGRSLDNLHGSSDSKPFFEQTQLNAITITLIAKPNATIIDIMEV